MSDDEKIDTRYSYFWIHNVFGDFVKTTIDYFADYLYPKFQWKVIGTFDKAVEYIKKKEQYNRETDMPMRPGLVLDPSGEFNFDDKHGKMLFRYPNLAPGMVKYFYEPIYQDQNVLISPAFSRVVGEFNLIGLMSSFYEYYDMRVYLNLIFGGIDRYIYPKWINSFIILPEELVNYSYYNDVTGQTYKIDVENAYSKLVKTTNTNELVFPCNILPRFKLTNISDMSSRLGGTDSMPDWKLGFTVNYEVELPTFIVLESDYLAENVQFNIRYGSCYTANKTYSTSEEIPDIVDSFTSHVDHGLDSTSNSTIEFPDEAEILNKTTKMFKTRYYHIVTQEEEDSETDIDITIPEAVANNDLLTLSGKNGFLSYGDHYVLSDSTTIQIHKEYVTLTKDDILEIYIYQYV